MPIIATHSLTGFDAFVKGITCMIGERDGAPACRITSIPCPVLCEKFSRQVIPVIRQDQSFGHFSVSGTEMNGTSFASLLGWV
jgi:hypothetical protein